MLVAIDRTSKFAFVELCEQLANFVAAYNFDRPLKTLTSYQYIRKC